MSNFSGKILHYAIIEEMIFERIRGALWQLN